MTLIRTMKTDRTHCGVQDRAVVLLLALVIDKENNSNKNSNDTTDYVNSSSYLIQRLQEVYDIQLVQQQQQDNTTTVPTATITTTKQQHKPDEQPDFLSFLKSTSVSSKGIDRLKKLITIVEQYERMKRKHTNQSSSSSSIGSSGSGTGTGTTNDNSWFPGKYMNRL